MNAPRELQLGELRFADINQPMPPEKRQGFLADLAKALPADRLITDEESLRPYECDCLTGYRQIPVAVALPLNESEAAAVLRVCKTHDVPVVARGAGTGLSGG
ncbi:MAG TPA: FAD-binding protein, partial [Burkholderiaceae bacterium]|nr:FAD-binding protein [Burkholderiaceae bacterium]